MEQNEILDGLRQAIIDGESRRAEEWANEAVRRKLDPILVIEESIRKGLDVVGQGFLRQEMYLPELAMAGDAATAASSILEAEIKKRGTATITTRRMVIGTVAGDIHDIGKNLVSSLFRAAGFTVKDLGVDVSAQQFVEAVREHKPDILGLSALLTTTIPEQKVVIDALKEAGLRLQIKVMVGGGAVTQEWADEIGADVYGEDAAEAIVIGKQLADLP